MSKRKINLEDFVERCKLIQPYIGGSGSIELYSESNIKIAMLEFGKQLLELAAENAKIKLSRWDNDSDEVDKQSITNTIKQVE